MQDVRREAQVRALSPKWFACPTCSCKNFKISGPGYINTFILCIDCEKIVDLNSLRPHEISA